MDEVREEARKAFSLYDTDGTGELEPKEVETMLASELCAPIRSKTLEGFMMEVDSDHNGSIDFEEFLLWYVRETDVNGINSKWARSIQTKAMRAAFQARKLGKEKAGEFAVQAKKSFQRAKAKYADFTASKELKHLVNDLRYPRDEAARALAMKGNDVPKAVAYLKMKGVEQGERVVKKKSKYELAKEKKEAEEKAEMEALEAEDDY